MRANAQNRRGLSRFCGVLGPKWDCPPLQNLLFAAFKSEMGFSRRDLRRVGGNEIGPAACMRFCMTRGWPDKSTDCQFAWPRGQCSADSWLKSRAGRGSCSTDTWWRRSEALRRTRIRHRRRGADEPMDGPRPDDVGRSPARDRGQRPDRPTRCNRSSHRRPCRRRNRKPDLRGRNRNCRGNPRRTAGRGNSSRCCRPPS